MNTLTNEPSLQHQDGSIDWPELFARIENRMEALSERFSRDQLEAIYSMAYNLLQQGSLAKAVRVLSLLTLLQPKEPKYWHVLGICCRRMGNHDRAVDALMQAVELAPDQFAPAFLLVESLLLMGRRDHASSLLRALAAAAEEADDVAAILRAEGLRELIELPLQ